MRSRRGRNPLTGSPMHHARQMVSCSAAGRLSELRLVGLPWPPRLRCFSFRHPWLSVRNRRRSSRPPPLHGRPLSRLEARALLAPGVTPAESSPERPRPRRPDTAGIPIPASATGTRATDVIFPAEGTCVTASDVRAGGFGGHPWFGRGHSWFKRGRRGRVPPARLNGKPCFLIRERRLSSNCGLKDPLARKPPCVFGRDSS